MDMREIIAKVEEINHLPKGTVIKKGREHLKKKYTRPKENKSRTWKEEGAE